MRAYHVLVLSFVLGILSLGALDVLHGGWEAVASGVMLLSALAAPLAFAVLMGHADSSGE